jgi:hypothetical protein
MKAERATRDSIERFQGNSLMKSTLTFSFHQFIGMYGIPYTAPLVGSVPIPVEK